MGGGSSQDFLSEFYFPCSDPHLCKEIHIKREVDPPWPQSPSSQVDALRCRSRSASHTPAGCCSDGGNCGSLSRPWRSGESSSRAPRALPRFSPSSRSSCSDLHRQMRARNAAGGKENFRQVIISILQVGISISYAPSHLPGEHGECLLQVLRHPDLNPLHLPQPGIIAPRVHPNIPLLVGGEQPMCAGGPLLGHREDLDGMRSQVDHALPRVLQAILRSSGHLQSIL